MAELKLKTNQLRSNLKLIKKRRPGNMMPMTMLIKKTPARFKNSQGNTLTKIETKKTDLTCQTK